MKVNLFSFLNVLFVTFLSISCSSVVVEDDKKFKKKKKIERIMPMVDRLYADRW